MSNYYYLKCLIRNIDLIEESDKEYKFDVGFSIGVMDGIYHIDFIIPRLNRPDDEIKLPIHRIEFGIDGKLTSITVDELKKESFCYLNDYLIDCEVIDTQKHKIKPIGSNDIIMLSDEDYLAFVSPATYSDKNIHIIKAKISEFECYFDESHNSWMMDFCMSIDDLCNSRFEIEFPEGFDSSDDSIIYDINQGRYLTFAEVNCVNEKEPWPWHHESPLDEHTFYGIKCEVVRSAFCPLYADKKYSSHTAGEKLIQENLIK